MEPRQIVLDTSVFVAALRSNRGASYRLLSLIGVVPEFEVNLSVPLVLEYEEVAKRQKSQTGLSDSDIDDIIDYLCSVGNRHEIFFLWRPFLKDPEDDLVLELAFSAGCGYIITFNEKDFASVERQFGIRVMKPQDFLRDLGLIP